MLIKIVNSFSAVLTVMLMIALGYVLGKLGYIKKEHKQLLTRLIISVGMPALVVNTVFEKLDFSAFDNPLASFILPLLSMGIMLILSFIILKIVKPPIVRAGGYIAMCAFSNSVFVGLPMNVALFGDTATPYVMAYYVINTTLFWTIGNYSIGKSSTSVSIRKSGLKKLLSPPLIALIICIPLAAIGFNLPSSIIRLSYYLGNIVTPLALIFIGFTLYEYGFHSLKIDKQMATVILMRLIISPLVMICLCKLFKLEGISAGVLIIESAMPVMTQAVVVAGSYDADEAFLSAGMCITTLSCFITVPLTMAVMQLIGFI